MPPSPKQVVATDELAMPNMDQLIAMIRVLDRKGSLAKQEVLEELKVMKREDEDRVRKN